MSSEPERQTTQMDLVAQPIVELPEHAFLVSLDTDGMFDHIYKLDRPTRIGRSDQCEIVIPTNECSRIHARIWQKNGAWFVEDLGSSNGTLVNRFAIEKTMLRSRDDISIAGTPLRFLLPHEPELSYHRTVEILASSDHLTGMNNREFLKRKTSEALDADKNAAFMIIDIDQFKAINDQSGHLVGDEVLIHVAHQIQEACGDTAIGGRISGDEFGVVVPDATDIDLAGLADRICKNVSTHPVEARGKTVHVTVSVGVATLGPGQAKTTSNIMAAADEQLYRSKNTGRNKASLAKESPATD